MSRKNNLKFSKTRQKAALERDKERRAQAEARRLRRHQMRVLNQSVARLTVSDDHSAAGDSLKARGGEPLSLFFPSFSSSSSSKEQSNNERPVRRSVNGNCAQETASTHVSAEKQGEEGGAAQQQRREDLRVRKSIAKGAAAGGRLGQSKDQRKNTFALGKKKIQMRNGKRVLVRGKKQGVKEIIRSRDKKILKQMKKRRKSGKQRQN